MPGFAILPAAITMVAGPQIISAVVLATSREAKRNSLAYIVGFMTAVVLGTLVWLAVMQGLQSAGSRSGASAADDWIGYAVVVLLAFAAIHAFRGRKTAEPPKWLTSLQETRPRRALSLGFVLVMIMPTDVAMMVSVAEWLSKNRLDVLHSLPFMGLTLLLISLPFLTYLLFGKRGRDALPGIRDWMNRYSWAINIGICAYFILSILAS